MTETRRDVLGYGGTVLAAAASLAGCLGDGGGTDTPADGSSDAAAGDGNAAGTATGDPSGDGTASGRSGGQTTEGDRTATDGESTATAVREATPAAGVTDWLPAPTALAPTGIVGETGYAFMSTAPAALLEFEDDLGDGAVEEFHRAVDLPGIETLGEATAVYRFARSVNVVVADFDRGSVEDGFRDLGVSEVGTHRGFTVFTASSARAAAVGDDAFVTVGQLGTGTDVDKRPVVEAVLDARTGNGPRYADEVGDCARLLDALGRAHLLQGRTHEAGASLPGAVGEGTAWHVGADRTRVRASVVFAGGEADQETVAEWAADSTTFRDREPTTSVDGRVVTATAAVPTGEITSFHDEFPGGPIRDGGSPAPEVNFGFEYETTSADRGIVTVTHHGGDTVPASELYVRGTGFADVDGADQTEPGPWRGTTWGDGEKVASGDRVEVGATSDYELSLVWESPDGDASATLARDLGPDA
ncbi:MAG: hypothetical protein ABEJ40_05490 [Haloarculaceae archaeon]